jgi:flavorubredoxin
MFLSGKLLKTFMIVYYILLLSKINYTIMEKNLIEKYRGKTITSFQEPTILYDDEIHKVYWLGIPEDTAFRVNTYLILDMDTAILIDPGAEKYFPFVKERVTQITSVDKIKYMVLCHQDPDVAASFPLWVKENPDIKIVSTARTKVLLDHYTDLEYLYEEITEKDCLCLDSGNRIYFREAPFMHFPGAFATYDPVSEFLFSGDIFAALDYGWKLVVEDFKKHIPRLNAFHLDYMASRIATKGFAKKISKLPLKAILPQHGSIISEKDIKAAVKYLEDLKCGLDLIYADEI